MNAVSFSVLDLIERLAGRPVEPFEFDEVAEKQTTSTLGAPYYATDHLGREYFMPVKLDEIQLPAPLIRVDAHKEFAVRKMVHREGTTKGLIGTGDYLISIRGICYSGSRQWPEEQVQQLKDLFNVRGAMKIENVLTSIMLPGEQKVVLFRGPMIEPMPGVQGAVRYSLELLSDQEFTLIVTPK